jgi:hypothetical protein
MGWKMIVFSSVLIGNLSKGFSYFSCQTVSPEVFAFQVLFFPCYKEKSVKSAYINLLNIPE